MTTTRRNLLVHGSVIGAGMIVGNLPGIMALAQGQPPRRRSLEGLAWNDPIVANLPRRGRSDEADAGCPAIQLGQPGEATWLGSEHLSLLPTRQLVLPTLAPRLHRNV